MKCAFIIEQINIINVLFYLISNICDIFSKNVFIGVLDDEFGEKTVSVLLDDEESELVFIDHPREEMSVS